MRSFLVDSFQVSSPKRRALSPLSLRGIRNERFDSSTNNGNNNTIVDVESTSPQTQNVAFTAVIQSTEDSLPVQPVVPTSDFDLCRMPSNQIYARTLYPYSVHPNANGWTATLSRPDPMSSSRLKHICFQFATEREAHKFCKSYAPPKFRTEGDKCMLCSTQVSSSRNCRNCGSIVCDPCSRRWGFKMVPKTYNSLSRQPTQTVRVCKSCDWLSNAFCMALLQGRYQDALALYDTGNVNLRTCFADIHKEAMFPVHCAVLGGNFELVRWLVDTNCCPISVEKGPNGQPKSVQTSACRTLLDLAMTGKPKIDILVYLAKKGISIDDVKDSTLVPKTLEAILKSGLSTQLLLHMKQIDVNMIEPDNESSCFEESASLLEDRCSLCCERLMDCVLLPCGHQMCCSECAHQLSNCPFCKVDCTVLRVFRQ